MKHKFTKSEILQIIKEEIKKEDKELNRKLTKYLAELTRYKRQCTDKFLNESSGADESLGELKVLEKITEDLGKILYNTEEEL